MAYSKTMVQLGLIVMFFACGTEASAQTTPEASHHRHSRHINRRHAPRHPRPPVKPGAAGVPPATSGASALPSPPSGGVAPSPPSTASALPPPAASTVAEPPFGGTSGAGAGSALAPAAPKSTRRASEPPGAASHNLVKLATFGSSTWGGRGLHHSLAAFSMPPYAVVLTVSDAFFSANGLFLPGDSDSQSTQQIHIAFSPVTGLEIGLTQHAIANKYHALSSRALQVLGNPALHLKYGYGIWPDLAVGLYAGLQLPTSEGGAGLTLSAFRFPVSALVSYSLTDRVEFVGNIGYTLDHSAQIFSDRTPDAVARFVYNINRTNQLTYALGAQGHFNAGVHVDFAPYVELSGGMGFGAAATRQNAPFLGTLGLKLYLTHSRSVEISGGADLRMGGEPQVNSPFAGLPPWLIFGQLSFHLNDRHVHEHTYASSDSAWCQSTADCPPGLRCDHHTCALGASDPNRTTFVMTGAVVDGVTAEPVLAARLTFSDFPNTVLAGDASTGQFATWPLATTGPPLSVRVDTPDYGRMTQSLSRGRPGEVLHLTLRMDPNAPIARGLIKGSIKDEHTGKPVPHAKVFIPVLAKSVETLEDGSFNVDVEVGLYQVLISLRGYVTQTKQVRVRDGDVVIINADLTPKRQRHR